MRTNKFRYKGILLFFGLFFILININNSLGQVITYNKSFIFTNDTIDERGYGVTRMNGRIFITSTIEQNGYQTGVAEIDSLGNKIWTTIIGDSLYNYLPGWRNCLNITSDGSLILTGEIDSHVDSAFFYGRAFIMKLTTNGQIIWMKTLMDTLYRTDWTNGVGVIETSDHGFAIIGESGIRGLLYKTDSLGEIQWYKTFGDGQISWYEYPSTIEELSDHGFIMGSYSYNAYDANSGEPMVYLLDSTGGTIWRVLEGGIYSDGDAFPVVADDSTIMVLTPYITKANSYGDPEEGRLRLLKIRIPLYQVLKDTLYGDTNQLYWVNQIRRDKDGTFVACGTDLYLEQVWLFRFNSEGDSLFMRRNFNLPDRNRYDTMREISGIIICPDGGILSVGAYYPVYHGEARGNDWIVKTDRYGCLNMGCDSNAIYILSQPDSADVCRDQPAEMRITTFDGNRSFQWQNFNVSSWTDITDTNIYQGMYSSSLVIDLSQLHQYDYWYRCKVYNSYYALCSDSAELKIKDTVAILIQPGDQLVRKHDTVVFSVVAAGGEILSYQWYRNGVQIPDGTRDTLRITSVTVADTGSYFCRLTTSCGPVDSRHAKLSINYTATESQENEPLIQYYPNPADNWIMVRVKTRDKSPVFIRILDISGRTLIGKESAERNEYVENIDLSTIKQGFYFLEIRIGETIYLRKIEKCKIP
ncbi:MAG: T9SS type A sorting domain-containing protein [Bacteroidetes bacterium]|nr:T9SS type A sorting domain-containing protein [Bacteroidota bacterium]